MRKLFFISGLPRSGSTLLCNILAQNPKIHTTPTSACHDILFTVKNQWNEYIEHKASKELSDDKNLQRVLNSILGSYHDTDREIIIDKGRGWLPVIELAEFALNKKMKILVPVRNVNQILASFEKLHRKSTHHTKENEEYFKSQTIAGRCDILAGNKGVVGLAYDRLQDAIQRGLKDRMLFVEFEDLTNSPDEAMKRIYNFLEVESFKHDFENVKQYTYEDDKVHGMDLHTIRQQVKPIRDDSVEILGEVVAKKYSDAEFWRTIK